MLWYSHHFQNFPVYCDPHKGFGIVNKAEIDVFLELSCFFHDPADIGNVGKPIGLAKMTNIDGEGLQYLQILKLFQYSSEI